MRIERTKTNPVVLSAACVLGAALFSFTTFGAAPASADFSEEVRDCRAAIAKSSVKLTKRVARTIAGCHKARSRNGSMAPTDCNDLSEADSNAKVTAAEEKFVSAVSNPGGACEGVAPSEALYTDCAFPCGSEVPSISTFDDVAECLVCVTRERMETLGETIQGTPASPLDSDKARCLSAIGTGGAKLVGLVAKDVTRCQLSNESAGAESVDFCTDDAFPSPDVEDGLFDAENRIVAACDLETFGGLDSCGDDRFGIAVCAGEETLEAAQVLVSEVLALPTTTSSTTTTTLPPAIQDPLCPDLGELVLYSRDSNIPCTTNDDCDPPRSCTAAGICGAPSDLDSGWTGLAHDSDLNNEVVTLTKIICEGPTPGPDPAPVCGQCLIDGVDPSTGSCRCTNNTRQICDEPFAADADDCGGNVCDCYFGVPIPLSSGGTPACIVNRYSQDLTGTANVDDGSSLVTASLRTKVFLGITTTSPCPFCAGTCSHDESLPCVFDQDCGPGNTCNQDTPNDGIRDGRCYNGQNNGLACDVGGINPSFPARSGGRLGGGGYSLDCMPSVGINISGAGLALSITQTTGSATLPAVVPCTGGNCPCRTCSASPQTACNGDGDCTGGSCAVSSSLSCDSNQDCMNVDLGTCSGINRCSNATSVTCSDNSDCQDYPNGGPCNPSTCSAIGNQGVVPKPNSCAGGLCTDIGNDTGQCTTGPDDRSCDGLLRADGSGILSCANNEDCTTNDPQNGACTLVKRRPCFLDTIVATGTPHAEFPVGAAAFCVPPTSNGSINSVAGLPGPTRAINQARGRALCANDHNVEYQSGVGGCP